MQTAVVKAMLDKNMPIDLIAEVTKLTEDEIKDIN